MAGKARQTPSVKTNLHPRNKHRGRYDLPALMEAHEELKPFVKPNEYQDLSIDFHDPQAVKALNAAILKRHYDIGYWDIPEGYLCPPVPGRVDLIHHAADLLHSGRSIAKGPDVRCLDIGVGANCIYPIVGNRSYGWSFVGTDVDSVALDSARRIIAANPELEGAVELRLQENTCQLLHGVVAPKEFFDLLICNPPFHASAEEAQQSSSRKVSNLSGGKVKKAVRNFSGQHQELWCEGGELRFISDLIRESASMPTACYWYTSLVSKESNVDELKRVLQSVSPTDIRVVRMAQGNKVSRLLAWTFFTKKQTEAWKSMRASKA